MAKAEGGFTRLVFQSLMRSVYITILCPKTNFCNHTD